MANPFYSAISGRSQSQHEGVNFMQTLQEFKADPIGFALSRKFNIPANLRNDPNAMLNYLLSTGQRSQAQVNDAYRRMMGQNF